MQMVHLLHFIHLVDTAATGTWESQSTILQPVNLPGPLQLLGDISPDRSKFSLSSKVPCSSLCSSAFL